MNFSLFLNSTNEKQAWNSLKEIVNGFLGYNRADYYQDIKS